MLASADAPDDEAGSFAGTADESAALADAFAWQADGPAERADEPAALADGFASSADAPARQADGFANARFGRFEPADSIQGSKRQGFRLNDAELEFGILFIRRFRGCRRGNGARGARTRPGDDGNP